MCRSKPCGWSSAGCGPDVASRGDGPRSQLLKIARTTFARPARNRARLACRISIRAAFSAPAALRRSAVLAGAERNTPCQILSTCKPIPAVLSNALWRF
jgi:hypothetical protein